MNMTEKQRQECYRWFMEHTGRAPTLADYERWAQRQLDWELDAVVMESLHGDWGNRD